MLQTSSTDRVNDICHKLAGRIIAEISRLMQSGQLVLNSQKYTLRPNLSRRYSVDPTILNFPIEEAEEQAWDLKDVDRFISQVIEPSSEYRELVRLIEECSGEPTLARSFAWRLAYRCVMTPDKVSPEIYVPILVNDIAGDGRRAYHAKVWLTGIRLAEETVTISDSLLLRKPRHEDVQEKIPERMVHFAHGFQISFGFSCIAELQGRFNDPIELQRAVDRLASGLRLFRLASVSTPLLEYSSESFLWSGLSQVGTPSRSELITCDLSLRDVPKLSLLLQRLMPVLPSPYDTQPKHPDFMSTALGWYTEAVLGFASYEAKVAAAIACLEALFLGDNPKSEITFRFVQRVTSLLRNFGWAPLQTRENLLDAYDVRSKFVHGVSPSKKTKRRSADEVKSLFERTVEYARVACLIWLQWPPQEDRQETLINLEKALVDDNARAELWRVCNRINFARRGW